MLCAKQVIHEPFVAINADDFTAKMPSLPWQISSLKEENKAHAMVGFTLKNVLSEHGSVSRGIGEKDKIFLGVGRGAA